MLVASILIFLLSLLASAPTDAAVLPEHPGRCPELHLDSTGLCVVVLQQRLNNAGFRPRLIIDGEFGKLTLRAVMTLQRSEGLAVEGVVGRKQRAQIISAYLDACSKSTNQIPLPGRGSPRHRTVSLAELLSELRVSSMVGTPASRSSRDQL